MKEVGYRKDHQPDGSDADWELEKKLKAEMIKRFKIDKDCVPVVSKDGLKVEVGLIIQRPPIFMHLRERDVDFMKLRQDIMNEYFMDMKQFTNEFGEASLLNEDLLAANPYISEMNLDNYPTHKATEEGKDAEYCAGSKYYKKVDPTCDDRRSIHYASEDRTFLILKNKYTGVWEFPTGSCFMGNTMLRCKQNLFLRLSDNVWRTRFFGKLPLVSTVRDFTEDEKDNSGVTLEGSLKGVRTYFFGAHHLRGLTVINTENNPYDDYAWIPKRQLNEYFDEEYYNGFIHSLTTR